MNLFERLIVAKHEMEGYQSEYRVVFDDPLTPEEPSKILIPDPNFMAAAMHGGILPPVWVYLELHHDEKQPGFTRHHRGYLLHETPPIEALTEEEAIEYLIIKDIPYHVWGESHNRPVFKICKITDLPATREYRSAWKLDA